MVMPAKAQGDLDNPDAAKRRKEEERVVLEGVDVACGTLTSASQPNLQHQLYKFVLRDEAPQSTEPQTTAAICLAKLDIRASPASDIQYGCTRRPWGSRGGVRRATNHFVRTAIRKTWYRILPPAHACIRPCRGGPTKLETENRWYTAENGE